MICRHCGMEIERVSNEDRVLAEASELVSYTNIVQEVWREIHIGFWFICPQEGHEDEYNESRDNGSPPYTWHEPLIESVEEILIGLRSIEADLR